MKVIFDHLLNSLKNETKKTVLRIINLSLRRYGTKKQTANAINATVV